MRSRFSNRKIFIPTPNSLAAYLTVCQSYLVLPDGLPAPPKLIRQFNEEVELLFTEDSNLLDTFEHFYDIHGDVRHFLQCILPAVYNLTQDSPFLTSDLVRASIAGQTFEHHISQILGNAECFSHNMCR